MPVTTQGGGASTMGGITARADPTGATTASLFYVLTRETNKWYATFPDVFLRE